MMMDLASTCDIDCRQCFRTVEDPENARMSLGQIDTLECEVFPYINQLALSCSGEPLTLRNFREGLQAAKRSGIPFTRIQTNGTHLSEEMSEFLLTEGLDVLGVSIDASTKETFEYIRRGASWDTVIGNLRAFRRAREQHPPHGTSLSLNFTLMKGNADEAVDFIHLGAELGADTISFSHLLIESWEMREWSLIYEPERLNSLFSDLRNAGLEVGIPVGVPENISERVIPFERVLGTSLPIHSGGCSAAEEDWVFLLPNGDLFPCANLTNLKPIGNVFETPFKDLWNSESNQVFRSEALQGCVVGCDRCKNFASTADPDYEQSHLARRLTTPTLPGIVSEEFLELCVTGT